MRRLPSDARRVADSLLTASRAATILARDKGRVGEMSGTPIYEQLCQDYVEAGKAWPGDVILRLVASQLTVPAHITPVAGDALVHERDDHLPLALAEWTHPSD